MRSGPRRLPGHDPGFAGETPEENFYWIIKAGLLLKMVVSSM